MKVSSVGSNPSKELRKWESHGMKMINEEEFVGPN